MIGFGLLPIAYYIIFANLSRSLLVEIPYVRNHSQNFIGSQWFSVLILAVLVFPLIIKKKIQELKVAGILLFSGVIVFILLMFILRIFNASDIEDVPPISESVFYKFHFDKAFLSSLSTAFVAYGFQSAFFPIYNSLEKKSYANGMKFTFIGIGFCFVIYMCIMFVSLYTFGIHIKGDVLQNVEEVTAWESYILRAIFLLVMSTHTPFIFFIGKESLLALIALCWANKKTEQDLQDSQYLFEDKDSEPLIPKDPLHKSHYVNAKATRHLNLSNRIISNSVDYNISLAIPFYSKSVKTIVIDHAKSVKDVHAAHDMLPNYIYYIVTLGLYAGVVVAA